jgi:hypothetical protein
MIALPWQARTPPPARSARTLPRRWSLTTNARQPEQTTPRIDKSTPDERDILRVKIDTISQSLPASSQRAYTESGAASFPVA